MVDGLPAEGERGLASVVTKFDRGALFLRNGEGADFRLHWDGAGGDRRRGVPPGAYVLTGYAIQKKDGEGHEWHVSVTGRDIREIALEAGRETAIDVPEWVVFRTKVARAGGGLRLQMAVQGERESGLSIYKDGRRISVRYRVDNAHGQVLAEGDVEYG